MREDLAALAGRGRMQALMERVGIERDKYGNLTSRLPPDLRKRHGEIHDRAIEAARAKGWDRKLGEDE